ncbi:MAG: ribonuclease Z [Prevotella sp.]|nr:ribonuclease Z [Prevotella sp.]
MEPFRLSILGCGSALPTMHHLPTCQVVDCRGKLFMIDCGEGAQLQMRRAGLSFAKLGHIFISHMHGDHCFGLIGLLSTIGLLGRTAKMHVYADKGLEKILLQMMSTFCRDLGYEVEFHAIDTTKQAVIYEDRSLTIETLPLEHRLPCSGFIFREKPSLPHIRRDMIDCFEVPVSQIQNIKNGQDFIASDGTVIPNERFVFPAEQPRSYAYVSDTKYMPQLAEAIKGVDLLYHEATYADDNLAMAEKYCHSTARQAALTARDAEVGQLLIGHYSSRYTDENVLLNEAKAVFENTVLADELNVIDIEHKK